MRVRTEHSGRQLPFERERQLVLRRLPSGALVSRAVLTVAPYSVDPGRRFLETIAFPTPAGDWGASKSRSVNAVEIDLHARRKLASLAGSSLVGGTLLVDLGGGYLGVDAAGGLGGTTALAVSDTMDLPGLTVTGLRVAHAGADIDALKVASPPSNLTVAVQGGPVFFTHLGDLVTPVTTPDFSAVLNAMLPELAVEDGVLVVPFVVHSDSIARLDLTLEVDFTVAVDAMPPGLGRVHVPYAYGGEPASAGSALSVAVPPGMVAVAGATTGRAQGAFESSTVVYGPVTATAAEQVPLTADGPLAHAFVLPDSLVASSVDLLLTAVTAQVRLAVDLVDDLDGKPGRTSLLSRPAELVLSRDQAGSPTWLNVALPEELELAGGVRRWLVLQARDGSATWGAVVAGSGEPVLQRTADGGLSWRAVPGDRGGLLRLRQTTRTFTMPLELRVGSGAGEVAVPLQQFAAQGTVDVDLSFDGVAHAVNTAVASSSSTPPSAEHVANGDFAEWYRVGTGLAGTNSLSVPSKQYEFRSAVAFAPDGGTLYAGARGEDGMRLVAFDVLCRQVEYDARLGAGTPVSLAVDPSGRRALVAAANMGEIPGATIGAALVLVDLVAGRPVGTPIPVPERPTEVTASPDGTGVYLLGAGDGAAVVRFVTWSALAAAAGGADLDWAAQPVDTINAVRATQAVGTDGRLYVLTGIEEASSLHAYADQSALGAGGSTSVSAPSGARDLTVTPAGDQVLVLTPGAVTVLRATDLRPITTVSLGKGVDAQCLAMDPAGEVALIVQDGPVLALDPRRRVLTKTSTQVDTAAGDADVVIAPTGAYAAVTRARALDVVLIGIGAAQPTDWELTAGEVRPVCLPSTGEVFALLGQVNRFSRRTAAEDGAKSPLQPAAMSQVVSATGATRYRFGFDGIALAEGATGQLIWRGGDCTVGRTDRIDVEVFDTGERSTLQRVPRHDLVVTSPPGAVQVEVRFATGEGAMLVDHVTLAGSAELSVATWQSPSPTATVTPVGVGVTVTNGGPVDAVVTQPVTLAAGQHFDLHATARVSSPGAAVELAFADETGAPLGAPARLALDPLDFDDRARSGEVPANAVEGELRIVVPSGGSVELAALSLTVSDPAEVAVRFVSEAPGDLAVSGVTVRLDHGTPQQAPTPPGGLCPASPAGDPDGCYCCSCGEHRPARRPVPVVTGAGRPATVSACPTCGASRIRLGGRLAGSAEAVDLPRYRTLDRRGTSGPALVVRTRVDVPITDIRGIGPKRAEVLEAAGIRDVVGLAGADVRVVAALPAVSERSAAALIAAAAELVRTRGRFVSALL
ncbi:helix-hairpin-helix domain-containing protein [Actinopolymorpha alba]|uniref:helix-hairpin-helix domain-containing protein n=1 Tax=Actinopolymorpha alba TaxID=533267 RepID=UPI00037D6BE9|nr:helix-hairpin-helix domain-containing protein [Actinopolymorpha alba]